MIFRENPAMPVRKKPIAHFIHRRARRRALKEEADKHDTEQRCEVRTACQSFTLHSFCYLRALCVLSGEVLLHGARSTHASSLAFIVICAFRTFETGHPALALFAAVSNAP